MVEVMITVMFKDHTDCSTEKWGLFALQFLIWIYAFIYFKILLFSLSNYFSNLYDFLLFQHPELQACAMLALCRFMIIDANYW